MQQGFRYKLSVRMTDSSTASALGLALLVNHSAPSQGQLLTFDAKLFHRGLPITSGRRYLLVGFCFTTAEAASTPGNLSTSLKLITGEQESGPRR